MNRIKTLLIANRGEIAVRIIRTARQMGIRTVAVFSDADHRAPHVHLADVAVRIGQAPVAESYLNAEAILNAARSSQADAIHPGYGFLSENADFAKAVEAAGLTFIGPPTNAIDVMGDKARSKRAMIKAGVPCIPGYEGEDQTQKKFTAAAKEIGFPVMVKASAGGGGRGMRLVEQEKDLVQALKLARSEAENAFGSGDLILEKAIIEPRHVEVQVFADAHGTIVHLGERDCSVQRRHQKVLEEAPCPVMTPNLRAEMGEAAKAAAAAVDYRGAGTVEFLLDQNGEFYFLEMNTRLQVEHPVTEMVTGLDLVEMQIRVAQGEPLDINQGDVKLRGHAIEARLYAEDPTEDFQPVTGRVALWERPIGEGIRCDDGIATGSEVSPFYDAMVAKIIAWGETRSEALYRLSRAVENTSLLGIRSNQSFIAAAIEKSDFVEGNATTAFVADNFGEGGFNDPEPSSIDKAAASFLLHCSSNKFAQHLSLGIHAELLDWSSSLPRSSSVTFGDETGNVICVGRGAYSVLGFGDARTQIVVKKIEANFAQLIIDGSQRDYSFAITREDEICFRFGHKSWTLQNSSAMLSAGNEKLGGGSLVASMHGLLIDIFVKPGDEVEAGARVAVLEAMKMQHQMEAEISGTVTEVNYKAGDQVESGQVILVIEEREAPAN